MRGPTSASVTVERTNSRKRSESESDVESLRCAEAASGVLSSDRPASLRGLPFSMEHFERLSGSLSAN